MKYLALALGCAVAVVIVRAWLLRTFGARFRRQQEAAAAARRPTARERVRKALAWPVFFVFMGGVLFLAVLVGSLVGPN